MEKTSAVVRGVNRNVYLIRQLADNKWRAKVYVDVANVANGRTSVGGVFQIYKNGSRRFTPTGKNGNLL